MVSTSMLLRVLARSSDQNKSQGGSIFEEISMGLRIQTNTQSLAAQRSLVKIRREQGTSLERLASGQRINRSGDDAAGMAIASNLKANIRSLGQASRNSNDGISMIQVAEGGLNEISNIINRLRELSIQSASDTIGDVERGFVEQEFQNMVQEVERIAQTTKFNERELLNGNGELFDFQVGIQNNPQYNRISFDAQKQNATVGALGMEGVSVLSKESSQENLDVLDGAIKRVNEQRANLGALQNRLQVTVDNLLTQNENLSAAHSRIRDTDVAAETSELARANILDAATTAVLAQANQSSVSALKLIG